MAEQLTEQQQIRRALLQAAEEEYREALAEVPAAPPFSARYRRWERRFLRDPFSAGKPAARLSWQRVLRSAACVLVTLSVVLGAVVVAFPAARAAVSDWTYWRNRVEEDHIAYDFEGYVPVDQLGRWEISALPEGYQETDFVDLNNVICVTYGNGDPEQNIYLDYQLLTTGGNESLDNEWHTISPVSVSGHPGQLFTSTIAGEVNMLLWIDEEAKHSFLLTSRLPGDALIQMAESVTLVN